LGWPDSVLQHPPQYLDILGERAVDDHQLLYLPDRMHDGGMIAAADFPTDLGQ
jgi:hypothetical protein